ncbi:endonuclease/exonuclease/phosphatase family protein [Thalassotalea sp. G2M2-11]|uniref:endonuclease/exonuclease/phosphatase family protein n=1 Tax=Thalassotalea sp. G2M2-11 TaxID=2787627 RepID=UPI0019D07BCC|nr:endonuclease/exonuclease/phosphatase family protein [Thalassotalea sp. G2M2-11]
MKHTTFIKLLFLTLLMNSNQLIASPTKQTLRVATFNVSMEALNYSPQDKSNKRKQNVSGNELSQALNTNHQQIKNIAEIIQRIDPDIILLNEFDFAEQVKPGNNNQTVTTFIEQYLNKAQNGQKAINYPYFYRAPVNTGVKTTVDLNGDGKITLPNDSHGFGYFPGHFAMVLFSKYPIDSNAIRTFQQFKWHDMPNALRPVDPSTNQPWYNEQAWQELRLSSKSHWDIPVIVNNTRVHVLASHPTPPVFDGPEDRNGNRNHDEIRFWHDYITPKLSNYIYDDQQNVGGLASNQRFVILGDQNASATEGDAKRQAIQSLLSHPNVQDAQPQSLGAKQHKKDNPLAKHHTAYWGMRADYVLPSKFGFNIIKSGVYWPTEDSEQYRLIKDRQASSDHRLVWVDLAFTE